MERVYWGFIGVPNIYDYYRRIIMANSLKKFIAVLSASAIVASLAPMAFAEGEDVENVEETTAEDIVAENEPDAEPVEVDDTSLETADAKVVFNEDYTVDGASESSWEVGGNTEASITGDGLQLKNTSTGGQRYSGITELSVSGSSAVEYDVKAYANTNSTYLWIGGVPSKVDASPTAVSCIEIKPGAATGAVNGTEFTIPATSSTTPWLHIVQIINSESKEVITTITSENGDELYNGSNEYVAAAAVFTAFGVSIGRNNASVTYKNIKISQIEAPVISVEDVSRIEVGTSAKVAEVTGATEIRVELSDESNFSYTIEDNVVTVEAKADAATGATTSVTIIAVGDVTVSKTLEVSALTAKEIVESVAAAIEPSGSLITKQEDGTYVALGNFTVPTADGAAIITWESDNANVKINASGGVNVGTDIEGTVTLTATVEYNGETATRDIVINIPSDKVYYDESFDDFEAGTLVDLSKSSNTAYKDSNGMTFACGSRDMDTAVTGASIVSIPGTTDKYLTLKQTKYTGQGRQPKVNLLRTGEATFNKSITISADIMFSTSDAANQLLFIDASSKQIKIPAPETAYLGKWLHYDITQGSGGTLIMVTDTDGKGIDYIVSSDTISNVAQMAIDDVTVTEIAVNNLKISDVNMTIPPKSIVEAGKHKLEITDLAKKNDVYTADTDFTLPAAPTGVKVSWAVMQKPKSESKWVDSSLISIAGTAATINPTSDVDDLDVKLVATITAGDASDTKEFAIDLPNPMDEITGFISAAIPVVNTTDTDAKGNTITFDLSKDAVLKYDLALPIKSKTYKNTTIAWTSSDESKIAIAEDGTAKIMTSDLDIHDVTLTAVVTYKKGNITYSSEPQKFDIKMGYTSEDVASEDATLGKYKVRFDAAYDANFTAIPSTTTSSITFPEKGYFGSSFTWNSSVPTVISNQGKYTRPSTTKSVVLTVSIEAGSAKESKQFNVTVPGSAGSSGGGGGGGGGSVSSSGTVSRPNSTGSISTSTTTAVQGSTATNGADIVDKLLEEKEQANDMFADVKDAAWARTEINGLAKAGIINGISDTQFAPNATVTRAEFAKMLMGAFGLSSASYTTSSFGDVATDAWYFQDVETAYNLGIINGVEDGVFAPDALITRQDMAVMVTRAADTAGKTIAEVNAGIAFADAGLIGSYAQTSVDRLVKAGIINGVSDTSFAPLDNATRAQAAKILYNFL